ncbi:MAG TPA: T9SS type A sorting domain-containing protein [Flavisolibacter sp.]|jgi:hypothetical protein|nr:T9SS type A sorting domain-containing protein [Flavisolibacter sp.]
MYQSLRTLLSTTKKVALLVIASLSSFFLYAQTGTSTAQYIPELVFQNPVLVAGVAGQDGATYRFNNVATDIDAVLTIKGRSAANVILTDIDLAGYGWGKALQPQLGIAGNVAANQNWWMNFEMKFLKAGTDSKKKIKGFKVTAIDVDGDGVSIREYVQMEKVAKVEYCPVTVLTEGPLMTLSNLLTSQLDGDNLKGISKMVQGPVTNALNIDTSATTVMATYDYEDKEIITFTLGAKSGSVISNAGERMSSLWFKAFSLAPPIKILPVRMGSFSASLENGTVSLNWSTQSEVAFSHFVLERSTNSKDWKDIATVFAMGGQGGQKGYSYKDKNVNASANVLYYRIRLVDDSRETAYTSIKVIRLGKEEGGAPAISVYPNPVQDALRVTLPSEWQNKAVLIEVYNSAGVRVKSSKVASAGQTENIIMTDVSKGFYLVKATNENVTTQLSIIKN